MKPILYKANETDFSTYGLGVLADGVSTLVTEERNGQFYLEMEYPLDGVNFNEIKADRLIKADASPNLQDQRFKIIRITKPAKGVVKVYAEHVSNHTADLQLSPNANYSGNASSALTSWSSAVIGDHPFTTYSNIPTLGSGKWEVDKVDNARRALGGVQGSILDTYGGEYRFDNYHIMLLAQRGDDNGLPIMYGKNLIDLEQEEEIANTYTSIMPYAFFKEEDKDEPTLITLPEHYIDSEYVSNYARRKILKVDFSQDEIETVGQLRARAQGYIKENQVGVPRVNIRVSFVDLAKTLDYKDIAQAEEINLCDWVVVYFEKLGISQKAKVIKTVWDVALERYEEVEVGEARASLSKSIDATVDSKLEPITNDLNTVQITADGKNRVFRGPDEPTGDLKVGDLWYKPIGDGETELYQWDGTMWVLIISTADLTLVGKEVDKAQADADQAQADADKALKEINDAVAEAGFTTLEEMATDQYGRISNVEQIATGLQTTVGDTNSGLVSQVSQVASGLTSVVQDLNPNNPSSQIYQLNHSIGSIVGQMPVNRFYYTYQGAGFTTIFLKDTSKNRPLEITFKLGTGGENLNFNVDVYEAIGSSNFSTSFTLSVSTDSSGICKFIATPSTPSHSIVELGVYTSYRPVNDSIKAYEADNPISQINQTAKNILIRVGDNKLNVTPETTFIQNATIKSAMIEGLTADKITAGEINAANINIINVNAKNIVGENADFIQASFNSVNSNTSIRGDGLRITTSELWNLNLNNGGVEFTDRYGNSSGRLRATLSGSGNPEGTMLAAESGYNTSLGRRLSSGSLRGSVVVDGSTGNISITHTTRFIDGANLNMGESLIQNAGRISFPSSSANISTSSGGDFHYNINASHVLRTGGINRFRVGYSNSNFYHSLNMGGNDITNTSDVRLKENIEPTRVKGVDETKRLRVVDYDWKQGHPANKNKPKDRQFGIIAQDSLLLQTMANESDHYLGVSLFRQVNLNTLTNQELIARVEKLESEVKLLKGGNE